MAVSVTLVPRLSGRAEACLDPGAGPPGDLRVARSLPGHRRSARSVHRWSCRPL